MDDSVLDAAFSALGDKTRRAILLQLMQGSSTVTALAEPFDMSLNAVSKHIKMLEKGGLVERVIKGRVHTISIAGDQLRQLRIWLEPLSGGPTGVTSRTTRPLPSKPVNKPATAATAPHEPESHTGGGLLDKLTSRLSKLGR